MQLVERDVGVRVRLQVGDVLRHLIGGGVGGEVAGRHGELRGRLGAGGELDEFPRVGNLLLVRVFDQPEVRAADEHAADGLVQHAGQIRHADLEVRALGDGGQLGGGLEGDGGGAGDEGRLGAVVVHAEVVADALVHQALPALHHQLAAAVGVVLDRGGHAGAAVLVVDVVVVGTGEQVLKEPAVDGQAHRVLRVALHARQLIGDRLDLGEGGRDVRNAGLLKGGLVVVHHRGGRVDRDAHQLAVHGVVVAQHALDLVKRDVRVLVEHVLEGNDVIGAGQVAGAQLEHLEHVRALAGGQRGLQLGQRVVVGTLELGDHLNIVHGYPQILRKLFADQRNRCVDDRIGIVSSDKQKIPASGSDVHSLPAVYFMSIDNDIAGLRLAEDPGEPHHWKSSRLDDILEHISRSDAGKLVSVPHQDQSCSSCHRLQKRLHELNVHHRHLINDDHIRLQRIGLISGKMHFRRRFLLHTGKLQHPVDSPGLMTCCLRHTLCSPAGGRRQLHIHALQLKKPDKGCDGSSFSGTRPSGNDQDAVPRRLKHGLPLPLVKLPFFLPLDLSQSGMYLSFLYRPHGIQLQKPSGHIHFHIIISCRIDNGPALLFLDDQPLLHDKIHHIIVDIRKLHPQKFIGFQYQFLHGQIGMPRRKGLQKRIKDPTLDPVIRIRPDSHPVGNLICNPESDTGNIISQPIGVLLDDGIELRTVLLKDLGRKIQ